MTSGEETEATAEFGWLVDVPLFIDEERIERLYDVAVKDVFKPHRKDPFEAEEEEESWSETDLDATAGGKVGLDSLLSKVVQGEVDAELGLHHHREGGERERTQYELSDTPQRRLAQIVLEYYRSDPKHRGDENGSAEDRNEIGNHFHIVRDRSDVNWDDLIDRGIQSPRDLVVLVLPGAPEIYGDEALNGPMTLLFPTAAEFEEGTVEPIYDGISRSREIPPRYPQRELTWSQLGSHYDGLEEYESGEKVGDDVRNARRKYWQWFANNFDPKQTTREIEEAAEERGDIRWIDFRLPIDDEGRTMHLHLQGREQYSTGTFAYNFVKRGYKHGLVIVGTVISEPDIDVLAVYER